MQSWHGSLAGCKTAIIVLDLVANSEIALEDRTAGPGMMLVHCIRAARELDIVVNAGVALEDTIAGLAEELVHCTLAEMTVGIVVEVVSEAMAVIPGMVPQSEGKPLVKFVEEAAAPEHG